MTVEVRITDLAHKGDGVAELDGRKVFVPRTAPGDVARVEIEGTRGRLAGLVEPSRLRVAPSCPHYDACGGCALLHLDDGFIATWKRRSVEAALAARGIEAEVLPTFTVPPRSRRRAVLAARRGGGGVVLGFHGAASHRLENVKACNVLAPAIAGLLPRLRPVLDAGLTRRGEARVTVISGEAGCDVAVALAGRPADAALLARLSEAGARAGLARLSWNGEVVARWHAPVVRFDGIACEPPPGAFLQAAEAGEARLRAVVQAACAGAGHVVDLFSGCGTFALPLARAMKVDAFDADAPAIAALDAAARATQGLRPVRAATRDLFRRPLLAHELAAYDAAILDPPRAGCEAQIAQVAASGLSRLAYVSCNPVSFARDARTLLNAGFRMGPVLPVDQFRWSAHVELAAVFERA